VLIADDNADARDIYASYLTWAGYDVATAEDGQRALEMADRLRPDVVVMDASMPRMDGWKAAQSLKHRAPELPIIVVTAGTGEGAQANATDYDLILLKPCLPQDLEEAVRDVLAVHPRRHVPPTGATHERDAHRIRVRRVHN
jgi:CheY-like chemotaxis protein